jgi:predicted nucleic acid-binding Zn ribbon protein
MKCPSCGTEVGPEDDFCGECGAQLPRQRRRNLGLPVVIAVIAAIAVGACVCVGAVVALWPSEPTPSPPNVALVTTTPSPGAPSPATPTATKAVAPTPTVPAWPLALQDNFDDPQSGFSNASNESSRYFYEGGRYGIETIGANLISWTSLGSYSDLLMEVTIVPEAEAGEGGVLFRKQGDYQFYSFTISTDGRYRVRRMLQSGGEGWETLLDWSASPALETGVAANRLQVVCVGSQISLYANGQYLTTVLNSSYTGGEIGLAVGTFADEARSLFYFDDLRVYAPSTGPGVLWQDDFSDASSGWETGQYEEGSVGYVDGYYSVSATSQGMWMWGVANRSFSDVEIEVDATQVLGPTNNDNAYGVRCRVQANNDAYHLIISGDGFYSIEKSTGGSYEALLEWTASDVILKGNATNKLRAVCQGSRLALYCNGQLLGETTDSTWAQGDIALSAVSLEAEPTEIHFDNLVVYSAPIG